MSELLLGDKDQARVISEEADRGLATLKRAEAALKEAESSKSETDTSELNRRADLLRAFAGVFEAIGGASESADSKQRLIDACGELAPYVDDEDKLIAESAKFWQGVAYRRAGKPERALQVLRPSLTTPASPRIAMFARIERCRALMDRGDYVSALALASRLSVRVDTWFDSENEATRRAAASVLRALRSELWKSWAAKLRADGLTQAAAQAEEEGGKMPKSSKADERLYLTEAVAGVPDLDQQKPADGDSDSKPDDESESP